MRVRTHDKIGVRDIEPEYQSYHDNFIASLLAHCEGKPRFSRGFPVKKLAIQSIVKFVGLNKDKRLHKQPSGTWFRTPIWRHCENLMGLHSDGLFSQICQNIDRGFTY